MRLDRRSYFLLLRAYGRCGDLQGAHQALQRMARDGAGPGLSMEVTLLCCYLLHLEVHAGIIRVCARRMSVLKRLLEIHRVTYVCLPYIMLGAAPAIHGGRVCLARDCSDTSTLWRRLAARPVHLQCAPGGSCGDC